jgi:threonyl-tRNA synthetase
MKHVYGIFGFQFKLELSTRPAKFLGEVEVWDKAEQVIFFSKNRYFINISTRRK